MAVARRNRKPPSPLTSKYQKGTLFKNDAVTKPGGTGGAKRPTYPPLGNVAPPGPTPPPTGVVGAAAQADTGNVPIGNPAARQAPPKMSAYERRRKGILDILNDPALAEYNAHYVPNYDAARSQIENAFAQAAGEIQSRQAAGEGLLAAMPGQISAAYGGAQQGIDASNAALAQAQAASGVHSFLAPGEATAPVTQALQMEQAGALSQVPTLGVGLSNLASEQRQQIGVDRGQALADLATKQEEAKASASDQGPSWVQQQLIQEELAAEDAKQNKKKSGYTPGKFEVSTKRGQQSAELYPKKTAMVQAGQGKGGKAYQFLVPKLKGLAGMGPNKQKAALAKFVAEARKKFPGHENAISIAVYDVLGG